MNRLLLPGLAACLLAAAPLHAQLARKVPLFEHFTQASCGPCAVQNPIFEPVRQANLGNLVHVAYHTSWPGVDPMYSANPTESDAMVGLYGVTGVPTMVLDGTDIGGPAGVTQATVDDATASGSPLRVRVTETGTGSRNVTVTLESVGTPPSGAHVLRVAVVEDPKTYATPPGSNGETVFPNVFRDLLTSTAGQSVSLPAAGSSADYTFSYTVDAAWNEPNVFAVAWVANASTREVLNAGSAGLPGWEAVNQTAADFQAAGASNAFNATISAFGGSQDLTITLEADQPADWDAGFSIQGGSYDASASVTVPAGAAEDLQLTVTPGASPGLGEYALVITGSDPAFAPQRLRYFVIRDVTDLVVTNYEGFGDGSSPETFDWAPIYEGGLADAGRATRAATTHLTWLRGVDAGALSGVRNLYYNVGWTFPSATDDKVLALMDFMDGGGNLFISGQDIGWEINEGNPTSLNTMFYEDYLKADYVSDGSPSSNRFAFTDTDPWFGTAAGADIEAVYGASYVYPERFDPIDATASPLLYYNDNPANNGGLRVETPAYKAVYLGIGVEMIDDPALRELAVKLAHDYFWDGLSGEAFEDALQAALLGHARPNPAADRTWIPLEGWDAEGTVEVLDASGRTVASRRVAPGQRLAEIDLTGLPAGLYAYRLRTGTRVSPAKKLTVVR